MAHLTRENRKQHSGRIQADYPVPDMDLTVTVQTLPIGRLNEFERDQNAGGVKAQTAGLKMIQEAVIEPDSGECVWSPGELQELRTSNSRLVLGCLQVVSKHLGFTAKMTEALEKNFEPIPTGN